MLPKKVLQKVISKDEIPRNVKSRFPKGTKYYSDFIPKRKKRKVMPGGLKRKTDRTELDLTPKQKMFIEIYVKDWGSITQAEALKRAGYVCTNEKDYGSVASRMLSRKAQSSYCKIF